MPELNISRDPQRSPMLWEVVENGAFTDEDAESWLPVVDASKYSVEAQIDDPDSMLCLTRELLALRKRRPSLQTGSLRLLDGLPESCLGFLREEAGERTVVLVSFGRDP
ncbi:MAG: hypothetical protein R2849_02385 [Thermomicrobiales bacterium]